MTEFPKQSHALSGSSKLIFPKSANKAIIYEHSNRLWVRKSLVNATKRFGRWPLSLNEIFASRLASVLGFNIPETRLEQSQNVLWSEFRGISLYQLNLNQQIPLTLSNTGLKSLSELLIFAHWIGDNDRTIHHITYELASDMFWGIDFEYCGIRPPTDSYPEPPAVLFDLEHITCRHALKQKRPISARISQRFPHVNATFDVFPWNASVVLFAIRARWPPFWGKWFYHSIQKINSLGTSTIECLCQEVYRDSDLAAKTAAMLVYRRNLLPKVYQQWERLLKNQMRSIH